MIQSVLAVGLPDLCSLQSSAAMRGHLVLDRIVVWACLGGWFCERSGMQVALCMR